MYSNGTIYVKKKIVIKSSASSFLFDNMGAVFKNTDR